MSKGLRIVVFASGNGSNLQAIVDACEQGRVQAEVVLVVSDNQDAYALERAKAHQIPSIVVSHPSCPNRRSHEEAICRLMDPYGPQLAVLAGYMRIVTNVLIDYFNGYVINIHPADTMAYQGMRGYEFALGLLKKHPQRLSETSVTVHYVDEGVDTGGIIEQRRVPVLPSDTLASLKTRGLRTEHQLYPEAIEKVVARRLLSLRHASQIPGAEDNQEVRES